MTHGHCKKCGWFQNLLKNLTSVCDGFEIVYIAHGRCWLCGSELKKEVGRLTIDNL